MYKRYRKRSNIRQRKRARYISRRKPLARKKRSTALTKKIRDVIFKTAERKWTGNLASNTNYLIGAMMLQQLNVVVEQNAFTQSEHNLRTGQEYWYLGSSLKYFIANNPYGTSPGTYQPTFFRTIIISAQDLGNTGAPTAASLIWEAELGTLVSFNNIANTAKVIWYKIDKKRYRTHFDKTVVVGKDGNGIGAKKIGYWFPRKEKIHCNEKFEGSLQQNKMYWVINTMYSPRATNDTDTMNITFQ